MMISTFTWLDARSQIANIQADGLELCYGIECESNFIGKVYCRQAPLIEYNATNIIGGLNGSFKYE